MNRPYVTPTRIQGKRYMNNGVGAIHELPLRRSGLDKLNEALAA